MGYNRENFNRIRQEYDEKYLRAREAADARRFQIHCEITEIAEIDKLLERTGKITFLQRQPSFVIVPKQVRDGKMIERQVVYKADFAYKDENGEDVVEDVKSPATKTKVYILKRKLMLWEYGIQIREV